MAPSRFDATSVVLENNNYYFNASGSVLKFDGYLRLYSPYEKQKDEILPELTEQEILESQNIEKTQHFTKPPARYSEAKLIKEMEELGIGRPSTYAMIIDTIQTRGYVELVDKTFKPTESGILTSDRLTQFFNDIINVEYTAQMEKELDDIAEGQDDYFDAIDTFIKKFQPLLDEANEKMEVKIILNVNTSKRKKLNLNLQEKTVLSVEAQWFLKPEDMVNLKHVQITHNVNILRILKRKQNLL